MEIKISLETASNYLRKPIPSTIIITLPCNGIQGITR
jgi:hypothetical protein